LKTTTPRYTTYLMKNFGLKIDDEVPDDLHRQQPDEAVGDYTEGVGETDPSWALRLVVDANTPDRGDQRTEGGIDLGSVRGDDFRVLRRALGRLIRAGIADALPHVLKMLVYVPSLTPWAIRYVIAAGNENPAEALEVLDEAVEKVSLSDWQRVWVIHGFDELKALDAEAPGESARRVRWVTGLRHSRCGPLVAAEAALALTTIGAIEFAELEYAMRNQPAALLAWYLVGVQRLRERSAVSDAEYRAIRGEGGLYSVLLPEES
jgi:hypothetical protein